MHSQNILITLCSLCGVEQNKLNELSKMEWNNNKTNQIYVKKKSIAYDHRCNVCSHAHTTKMEILYHEKKTNNKKQILCYKIKKYIKFNLILSVYFAHISTFTFPYKEKHQAHFSFPFHSSKMCEHTCIHLHLTHPLHCLPLSLPLSRRNQNCKWDCGESVSAPHFPFRVLQLPKKRPSIIGAVKTIWLFSSISSISLEIISKLWVSKISFSATTKIGWVFFLFLLFRLLLLASV